MFEKDPIFVRDNVLRVMRDWGVTPTGRGTGEGDFAYWVDSIIAHEGWEPYWENVRMPNEFLANGHVKGGTTPPVVDPPVPPGDPYMVKLNAMHDDLRESRDILRRVAAKFL